MHVQRMLKMSRGLYTGGNFKQNTWKKRRKIEDLICDLYLTNKRFGVNLFFYQILLCDHCLQDYHLYIRKMLTNREMVNFQKWGFFRFFFILLL